MASDPNRPVVDESIEDVGASTSHYLRHHPGYFIIPLAVAVCIEVALILFSVPFSQIYLFPIFIPIVGYSIARSKVQHEFMQQFAAANSFSYSATGSLNGLDGSLFQIGHDRSVVDLVAGQFQEHTISLFTYTYVTGSGKEQQTHHDTVFQLQFDSAMPDMLLENGAHHFGDSLFGGTSGKELVRLEGDFNKYFSLYIPKGYEVEALEVLRRM